MDTLLPRAERAAALLKARGETIAVAESSTGGLISAALLALPGARALLELREHRRAIDWLITSTSLPGLVDGAILGDEFRSVHPTRRVLVFSTLAGEEEPAAPAALSPAGLIAELQALAGQHSPALPVIEIERVQALAA